MNLSLIVPAQFWIRNCRAGVDVIMAVYRSSFDAAMAISGSAAAVFPGDVGGGAQGRRVAFVILLPEAFQEREFDLVLLTSAGSLAGNDVA